MCGVCGVLNGHAYSVHITYSVDPDFMVALLDGILTFLRPLTKKVWARWGKVYNPVIKNYVVEFFF